MAELITNRPDIIDILDGLLKADQAQRVTASQADRVYVPGFLYKSNNPMYDLVVSEPIYGSHIDFKNDEVRALRKIILEDVKTGEKVIRWKIVLELKG